MGPSMSFAHVSFMLLNALDYHTHFGRGGGGGPTVHTSNTEEKNAICEQWIASNK